MKKNFLFVTCLYFLLSNLNVHASTDIAFPILTASPDARISGMGEAGTAVARDMYATYWNPGILGFLKSTQIPKEVLGNESKYHSMPYFEGAASFHHLPLYTNSQKSFFSFTGGVHLVSIGGTFVFDYSKSGLGEMVRMADNGTALGKYIANEYCYGLAYGMKFGEDVGLGIKAKYFSSNLAPSSVGNKGVGSASGLAFDLGFLWNPDLNLDSNSFFSNRCVSFGISLQNLGTKKKYRNEYEPLPTRLRLGAALELNYSSEHKVTLALDAVKNLIKRDSLGSDPLPKSLFSSWDGPLNMSIGIGSEYWFKRLVALRIGYYTEPGLSGNRDFLTFGGSVRIYIMQVDLSYNITSGYSKYLNNVLKMTARIGG